MKASVKLLALAAASLLTVSMASARAGTVTFTTASGTPAQADIVTGAGTITLTLTNLGVNPGSVAENISAFNFTLGNPAGATSLASMSSFGRIVASDGTYTDSGPITSGWVQSMIGASTIKVDVLAGTGHAGPAETILGMPDGGDLYSAAGGSIAGNGPHNPFLNQTATFVFSAADVTALTTVTAAQFQFGTTDGEGLVPGVPSLTTNTIPVPVPAAAWSGMMVLGGLGVAQRLRKKLAR
jgi:hypothetical protein